MVTIYDLLEVSEDASKEDIEKAYKNMRIRYRVSSDLTEKENRENEFIIKKLKMAYDILINDEKRSKYDKDLAQKRAEDLIKKVAVNQEEPEPQPIKVSESKVNNVAQNNESYKTEKELKIERYDKEFDDSVDYPEESLNTEIEEKEDEELTNEEQKKLRKAAQEEFKRNLKKAQKAEEEYNQAYNEAYNNYMKKMKYKTSGGRFSFRKLKNTLITIIVIIVVSFIAWQIPPVRNSLTTLYNDNAVIKIFVDIIISIFKSIFGMFIK